MRRGRVVASIVVAGLAACRGGARPSSKNDPASPTIEASSSVVQMAAVDPSASASVAASASASASAAIVAEAPRVSSSVEVGQPLHFLLDSRPPALTQVSDETVIRDAIFELSFDGSVNFGPAFSLDAMPPRFQVFALGSRPELTLDEPFANLANAPAHVLTRHGERDGSTIPVKRIPHSPQQNVSVPVLGVLVLDRHPLELCPEVLLHLCHHVPHVLPQVNPLHVVGT